MKILSIETSCDDTSISIMEMYGSFSAKGGSAFGGKVLANASNSQIKIHIPYGGVFPMLAKREHIKNLPILLEQALKQVTSPRLLRIHPSPSKVDGEGAGGEVTPPVDVVAVTYGPGLEPALWAGITFAQELAKKWHVPVVPVNHMEGHVLSVFGKDKGKFKIPKVQTPILSLLVSGGHTQLVLTKKPARLNSRSGGWLQYEIIGETLDDAVGEAFDKVARMLGLPYPGGPEISKLAEAERAKEEQFFRLPRPMLHSKNFDFSYAGLKTAVLYLIKKIGKINDRTRAQIALEFENAAIECLVYKTKKAMEKYKIKTLIVAGGVAANKHLRNEVSTLDESTSGGKKIKTYFPTPELSGDNSIMIGIAGYLNYIKNKKKVPKLGNIKAIGNLRL